MAETFLTLMADWDGATQAALTCVQQIIDGAGFQGTHTRDIPYHISLATFPLDEEERAIRLTRRLAEAFAPLVVDMPRLGVFPGGRVLFAAPEANAALTALQASCGVSEVGGYPWTPHTTLLIDEAEVIARALPIAQRAFRPVRGHIAALHLCAFFPTREILTVPLKGTC